MKKPNCNSKSTLGAEKSINPKPETGRVPRPKVTFTMKTTKDQ
jgi:hypothetical protein